MKAMLVFMEETSNHLLKALNGFADKHEDFELKEVLGKYSMDTIASCAFGVDAQSFTNKDSLFAKYASNIFQRTAKDLAKIFVAMLPFGYKLFGFLNISVSKGTETEFFYNAVMSSLKHRQESKTRRNDLIDLMMDAISGDIDKEKDHEDQFEKVTVKNDLLV